MSTLELNAFPSDAFRAILAIDAEQRELIKRYMECSDEAQSVVCSMFAGLEHEHAAEEDRAHGFTIAARTHRDLNSARQFTNHLHFMDYKRLV